MDVEGLGGVVIDRLVLDRLAISALHHVLSLYLIVKRLLTFLVFIAVNCLDHDVGRRVRWV